jgi:outer membrane protein assembly factor BamB
VVAAGKVFARESDAGLRALDDSNGMELWTSVFGGVAAVDHGLVHSELTPLPSPFAVAFRARYLDGSVAWSNQFLTPGLLFLGDAVVANDALFVTWSGPGARVGLERYKASDGTTDPTTGTFGRPGGVHTPALANGVVYATTADGLLHALDAADLRTQYWQASVAGGIASIDAGRLYITSGTSLMAFDAAGRTNCAPSGGTKMCTPLWTTTTADTLSSQAPAVGSGIVSVRSDRHLYAFDPATGALRWSAVIGSSVQPAQFLGSPSIVKGVVFVGSLDAALEALDAAGSSQCSAAPRTCAPLKRIPLVGPTGASQPAIVNNSVYIGALDVAHQKSVSYKFSL